VRWWRTSLLQAALLSSHSVMKDLSHQRRPIRGQTVTIDPTRCRHTEGFSLLAPPDDPSDFPSPSLAQRAVPSVVPFERTAFRISLLERVLHSPSSLLLALGRVLRFELLFPRSRFASSTFQFPPLVQYLFTLISPFTGGYFPGIPVSGKCP